jgi:hypothetical protein
LYSISFVHLTNDSLFFISQEVEIIAGINANITIEEEILRPKQSLEEAIAVEEGESTSSDKSIDAYLETCPAELDASGLISYLTEKQTR